MGKNQSSVGKQDRLISKEIEDELNKARLTEQSILKLLFLGTGESGKSTIFKQLNGLFGKGLDDEHRKKYISVVHQNVMYAIIMLAKQSQVFLKAGKKEANVACTDSLQNILSKTDSDSPKDCLKDIIALWKDSGIQYTFENQSGNYHLFDSTKFYLDKVEEVCKDGYLPTKDDVVRSRQRTSGIVESHFIHDTIQFKIFDVGGQRNERKKWIHCFEGVTSVIFVASLSEYDQVLAEDSKTNRAIEALDLFEEICNSKWFETTSMILFLNKKDILMEKIKKIPLTIAFPDYKGKQTYEDACNFFTEQFTARNKKQDKKVYTHITCATDRNNISHVFNSVKDILLRDSLKKSGLLQ